MSTSRSKQTAKGKRNVKRQRRNNPRLNELQLLHNLGQGRLPKDLMGSAPFPGSMTKKMLYHQRLLLQGAVSFVVQDYSVNSAFSPGTSGSCTGFSQLAAIYAAYLVIKVRFRYNVVNNENALPVYFGCIARDTQPSTTITTWAQANDSLELAPTTGPQAVGETSGQGVYRSKWYTIDPSVIVGNPLQYYGSGSFSGNVTGSPSAIVWVSFILASDLSTTNLTNGAFLDMYLELTTEFFDLKNLAA